MKLVHLVTYRADLKPPVEVGKGPFGTRSVFDRLDVRGTLETDDGAHIYVHYHGVLEMNEKVLGALQKGEATDYGDTYFMTQPRFETGE
jgi:hypothetical protein